MWWTPKPISKQHVWDFPHGLVVKNLPSNIGDGLGIEDPTCHTVQPGNAHCLCKNRATQDLSPVPAQVTQSQDLEAVAPGGEDFFMVSRCFDPFVLWNIMEPKAC